MDMDESEDEAVGCETWALNFLHYFLRDPLDEAPAEGGVERVGPGPVGGGDEGRRPDRSGRGPSHRPAVE